MNTGTLPAPLNLPSFDTHIPFVGKIDFNQPMEWLFWGGLAADLILVSGFTKWIIAAGILAARYEYGKYQQGKAMGII